MIMSWSLPNMLWKIQLFDTGSYVKGQNDDSLLKFEVMMSYFVCYTFVWTV